MTIFEIEFHPITRCLLSHLSFWRIANQHDFEQLPILYNLIIIGEVANQVTDAFQDQYHLVPWVSMIGTRNIIVHGYDQIKLQIVWNIMQRDLVSLKKEIFRALGR